MKQCKRENCKMYSKISKRYIHIISLGDNDHEDKTATGCKEKHVLGTLHIMLSIKRNNSWCEGQMIVLSFLAN